jgi:8-amino-7-oxononanoate synthase
MPAADPRLAAELAALAAAGRSRRRRTVETRAPGGVRMRIAGRDCIAFCSNDYLGLADHPAVVEAFCDAAREWGVGSSASHLVSGHDRVHQALEEELAEFVRRPRALLFSTGYMANLAVAAVMLDRGDLVLEDRLNHASLLDAGLASKARFARYAHCEPDALRLKLSRVPPAAHCLVMSDGVFSMDGDVAPLPELAAACRAANAELMIDDAHGFGVLGATGAGTVEEAGLGLDDVPVLMCTLGKAAGTFGAFVAGSETLIESLVQRARTYLYTTALPPAVAAATRAALRVMRDEPWRRERVLGLARTFREAMSGLGLRLGPSRTPIQPLVVGSEAAALAISAQLLECGCWVSAIRPPTVPDGTSRLRFTFSASHSDADLGRLVDALAALKARGALTAAPPA